MTVKRGIPGWGRRAVVGGSLAGIAVAGIAAAIIDFGWHPMAEGGDAWNYLAAGERLNAGHPLYSLMAGDRPVPIVLPYWTVPLLAPPPVAVVWRPLALLGDGAMVAWTVAALVSTIIALALLPRTMLTMVALALLAAPLTLVALSGNASAFVLLGLVVTWTSRSRPVVVGTLVAALAAVKLTPIVLLVWLAATRRWRAVAWTATISSVILVLSVAGASIDSWLAWLAAVPQSAPSPLSLSTVLGISPTFVGAVGAGLVAATWVVTRSDRTTFAAAVAAAALTTPALYFQALALLAACAAPGFRRGTRTPQAASARS